MEQKQKIVKKPSNASIRRALTTLKKAELIHATQVVDTTTIFTLVVDNELVSPKKTIKRRIPKHKKVEYADKN